MKTPFFLIALSVIMFMSCHHEQVRQFTVGLQYADGTKESYAMYEGSMLSVNVGNTHVVAKAIKGDKETLELEVARYTITRDSMQGESTIQKAGTSNKKISTSKGDMLDPDGTVQVNLQSMAMIDTGRRPKGACQGNCCEAKCFSTFCCSDPDECKNVPCDCKPPAGCPQPPSPGQVASHFFELYMSGKDMMVFKD